MALDISEDNNSIIRDNSFQNYNAISNSQIQNLNCQNSDKMNINTNNISNINNNIYSNEIKNINNINSDFNMNNHNSNINNNNHTINMNNFYPMNMMNNINFSFLGGVGRMNDMNYMNGINMNNNINLLGSSNKFNPMMNYVKNLIDNNFNNNFINNFINNFNNNINNNFNYSNYSAFNRPKNESVNNNSQLEGFYYHPFENKLNSSYNISSNKSNNNNDLYLINLNNNNDLYLINLQKFVKEKGIKVVNKIKNESKPKKYDFNYLEIIIKNNDNIDNNKIDEALNKFIKNYIEKIKCNFSNTNIEIYINNITNFSFNINYNILSIKIDDDDEIIFLDEKYENTIKNGDKYEIKVELIKGKYNNNNLTYQYYLIFKPYGINQEDFYEQIKILKNLAISLLNKK